MAFSKNYIGDTKTLEVILQTIGKKNAIIPGVTVKAELAGMVQANVAEFYYDLAPAIETGDAGGDFGTSNVGSKKAVLPLSRGVRFNEKVPQVAVETIAADVVMDKMVKGALALSNEVGKLFIEGLKGQAKAATYTNGLDMYEAVIEGIATFSQASSSKIGGANDTSYSNAVNGIQPTTLLVGDKGRGDLLKTPAFQRLIGEGSQEIPGLIGKMFGLDVVYVQDLTEVDFVLLNKEGVAFPYSLNALRVIEDPTFYGVRVQGEVAIPDANTYAILPINCHAIKFTEAAGA
jgi:hypothetical protein